MSFLLARYLGAKEKVDDVRNLGSVNLLENSTVAKHQILGHLGVAHAAAIYKVFIWLDPTYLRENTKLID